MKALHVVASLAPADGGAATAVIETCRALHNSGQSVVVITTDADGTGRLPAEGQNAITADVPFPVIWTPMQEPRQLKASWPMLAHLLRVVPDADVIHVHGLYLFHTWAASRAARRGRKPYVVQPHGGLDPYQQSHHTARKRGYDLLVGRTILRRAAAVVFTDDSERDLSGRDDLKARAAIVPLGAEVDVAPAGYRPAFVDWPDYAPVVLFLGRVTEKKRPDLLVRAWAEVARRFPEAVLVIAGPADEPFASMVRAEAFGLPTVKFVGPVYGDDKAWLLRQAKLFVLPSENENFAIAVAEALSVGCPVITTEAVALGKSVREHGAGLVLDRNSATAMAAAVISSLAPEQNQIFQRGAIRLGASLTWRRSAELLTDLYAQLN